MMPGSWVYALGWALLHSIWQVGALGIVCVLAMLALRRARPQARYFCLCLTLCLAILLPIASTFYQLHGAQSVVHTQVLMQDLVHSFSHQASWSQFQLSLLDHIPMLVLAWALGVVFLALRLVLGLAWLNRSAKNSVELKDVTIQASVARLCQGFARAQQVTVRVVTELSDTITGPVTIGIIRPLILLPAALLTAMPAAHIEAILAHELAHIRRHDYLINLIQNGIAMLLFFHPMVWWLTARINAERELIADDLAVQVTGEPRRLALALHELDQFQFVQSQLALTAHGGNLMSRIKRLLRPEVPVMHGKTAATAFLVASMMLALAAHAVPTGWVSDTANISSVPTTSKPKAAPAKVASPVQAASTDAAAGATKVGAIDMAEINFNKPGCKPNYPRSSLRNEEQGYASYDIQVSERGKIQKIIMTKSSGFPALDQAVIEALSSGNCLAKPGRKAGKPVTTVAKVQYVWRLE